MTAGPTVRAAPVEPVIDGLPVRDRADRRLGRQAARVLCTREEREEAELERRLRSQPPVSRPNVIALMSPKRRIGKTTSTIVLGSLLAGHLKARTIAVDTGADLDTVAQRLSAARRGERSTHDLLEDLDRVRTAAELNAYVSRTPTGLHVLAARDGGDRVGELVAFLSCFYEVVLLDARGAMAPFAIARADQLVLVVAPELLSSSVVLNAVSCSPHERTIVAINQARLRPQDPAVIEDRWRGTHPHRAITIPHDEQLDGMLATGTYTLDALQGTTRRAIKRLGLAVAERLV
jgi:MinD-like ATPase involved in chromosome partitioning or flagellar assembly